MGGRDLLDALNIIEAASDGIDQALRAARDHHGEVDPMLVDVDLVEQHRSDLGWGLDCFEEASGRRRARDDEYARVRRVRFGQLPARILPGEMVEVVDPNPIRETHEPAEPRREWA
jgi:hypothetical protein